ncbi:hypothetical protein LJC45_03110 [Alistipes sp. OttesenSCG-928-B03]|nr:hypothetical protein [Alistipes sp. OttesenSCG-928-B03]
MKLFDLVYTLIPNLISSVNSGRLSYSHLWNFGYWKEIADASNDDEEGYDFDWNKLSYALYSYLDNYYLLIIFSFPQSFQWPYPKYGAIVIDNEKKKILNYYTSELAGGNSDSCYKWALSIIMIEDGELRRDEWGDMDDEPTIRNFIKEISAINSFPLPRLLYPKSKSARIRSMIWSIALFLISVIFGVLYLYLNGKS